MSEGAGFVNRAPLVERHGFALAGARRAEVGRARADRRSVRRLRRRRAVKAGRRPPVGEALTARSVMAARMTVQARRACWMPFSCVRRCAGSFSRYPIGGRQASSAAWSCLRRVPTKGSGPAWSGPAQPTVLNQLSAREGQGDIRAVCWPRPSFLIPPLGRRGNGSHRRAARSRRGTRACGRRRPGRCFCRAFRPPAGRTP